MKLIKVLLIFTLSCVYLPSLANHVLGGNISYECLGGNDYEITFTIYKDCLGATSAPPVEDLFFIPNGCSSAFSAPSLFQSETEISDLCPSEFLNSSCSGGFIPGALELTYTVIVNLDPACTWTISWASGGWNYFVNMDNSSLPFAQIQTIIDPTMGCNSSVTISDTNNDIPYFCSGEAITHQLEVDNPNGYDLVYSLCDALTTGGVSAPYDIGNGFSGAQPIPGIAIDAITGEITFTAPAQFGNYVVVVCIEMYDGGGNLVGTFIQNMSYVIRLCTISPTNFIAPGIITANPDVTVISGTEISACVGDSLCFTVSAENGNVFRTILMSSDFTTLFPGGSFTTTGTNPVTGEVCVFLDETMIGTTDITFDVIDDGCPVPEEDQLIVSVTVSPSLEVSVTDITVCNGDNLVITASGDTDYSWNIVSGTANPSFVGTGGIQDIVPTSPMVVEVVANNAAAACNVSDTLTIDVSLWDLDFVVTDETCNGNDGTIDLTVSGGSGNYGYNWPDIPSVIEDPTGLTGGSWVVTVEDIDNACFNTDSVAIGTSPPPSGDITGDITICEGDCADITFNLSGTPTFDVTLMNITAGNAEVVPPVSDTDTYQVCPTETTVYELQSLTDSNNPQCTYNTPSQVTVTVRPIVNASFIDPGNACAGDDVDLELDIDQTGTYDVIYEIDGNPEPVLAASDGTIVNVTPTAPSSTYSITSIAYQDAPLCSNLTQVDLIIIVDPLPTALFTTIDTICDGEDGLLHFSLTGTGPWIVTYTENGGADQTLNIDFNEFDWLVSPGPSVDTEYCITHVEDTDTGCEQDVNSCTDIFVNTLPNGSLSTDGTICNGDQYDITLNLNGNGPFDLDIEDGGGVAVTGVPNPANDQDLLTVSPTNDETYCLTQITDNNGCSTILNDCVDVTVNPLPTIDITGNDLICTGDCYDLVINNMTGTAPFGIEYEMFADDDDASLTINNVGAMNNGDMITVCPTEDAYIVINQIVDSSNPACTNTSVDGQFDLTVNEYTNVSVSQDSTICLGGTVLLTFCFENYASGDNLTVNLTDGQSFSVLGNALDANGCFEFSPIDPVINTTYTIDTYTNDGNTCSAIIDGTVDISITQIPTATLSADQTICLGVDADLVVDIPTVGGPFDIIVEQGSDASETIYEDIVDGFIFQVSPNQTDTYTITFIADSTTAAACNTNPASMVTITIPDLPQIISIDTLCVNTGEEFQIEFEITGGDPLTYNITNDLGNDPGGSITAGAPYIYTSGVINSGLGECWNVSDATGCPPDSTCIQPFDCPTITYSGSVDTTSVLVCCDGNFCVTQNGDEVLDDNDVLSYVVMNNPDFNSAIILDVNSQNCWDVANDLGALNCGNTYYVAVIAGNDDGGGLVDLTNPNISISEVIAVTLIDIPTAEISGGGTICQGDSVQITIDLLGGFPWNFDVMLDGAINESVAGITTTPYTFFTQDAGAYTLSNVNNTTCTGSSNGQADVVVNPIPTATISNDGNICEGDSWDFDITLAGTTPWTFTVSYDDGINPIVDDVVAGVNVTPTTYQGSQEGTYFITEVSDDTGCANTGDSPLVTLVVNALPDAQFAFGDSSYCAGSSIDLLIDLDGLADWTIDYNIDNGATQQWGSTSDSTFTQTVNAPGTYEIESVTDGNNCTAIINESIVITEIPIPVADAGGDILVCSNIDQLIGSLDDPTLTYLWSGDIQIISDTTIAQPTVNVENLGPGVVVYNLTLTVDDNSCDAQDDIVVTIEPEPDADAGQDVSICYGAQYQLSATGGIDCDWTDNGTFIDPADICDPFVQPLISTTYVVEVTGANTCTAIDTVLITVPDEFLLDVDFSPEVCFGACDGSLEIIPQGGYPGYSISWDNALDSLIETDACAGIYTYTVTDSLGCELIDSIEILELPIYEADTILITHPTCFGFEDGQIEVIAPGTVEYVLLGVDTNATGIFSNLPQGDYEILLTNNIGCQTVETVSLDELSDEIFVSSNFEVEVTCFEEPTDFIANATGGLGEFEYNWYNNEDLNPPIFYTGDTLLVEPIDTTIFWVVAIDEIGCNSDTLQLMTVFNPPIQIASIIADSTEICQGECVDLNVEALGGNGVYTYDWVQLADPDPIVVGAGDTQTVCPMEDMVYMVSINDECSPELTATINIIVHETPDTEIFSDTLTGCFPLTITLNNITDTSLTNTCNWDFGDGNTLAVCSDVTYTYTIPGTYYPTLTVNTEFGCSNTDSTEFVVEVYDFPDVDFIWEPEVINTLNNDVQFLNLTTNAVEYSWDIAGLLSTNEPNPSILLPPVDYSSYYVCLIATSNHGCVDTLCQFIDMESNLLVWVPNAFTPDGDGINDVFLPSVMGVDPSEYTFRIWDRWGHIVFETNEFGVPWIGDNENGDHYAQNDVYVWQIEAKEISTEEIKVFTGRVTIFR